MFKTTCLVQQLSLVYNNVFKYVYYNSWYGILVAYGCFLFLFFFQKCIEGNQRVSTVVNTLSITFRKLEFLFST